MPGGIYTHVCRGAAVMWRNILIKASSKFCMGLDMAREGDDPQKGGGASQGFLSSIDTSAEDTWVSWNIRPEKTGDTERIPRELQPVRAQWMIDQNTEVKWASVVYLSVFWPQIMCNLNVLS